MHRTRFAMVSGIGLRADESDKLRRVSAHAERVGRHHHGIAVAEKTVGLLVSGHADVDFRHGVVRVSLVRRLRRQNAASLDPKRVNTRQPVNGSDYARPIFGGKILRQSASG